MTFKPTYYPCEDEDLGPGWTYTQKRRTSSWSKTGCYPKVWFSPSGQRFVTLKSAKEHASLAKEKKEEGAAKMDYPLSFDSLPMDADSSDGAERKKNTSTSGVLSTLQDVHDTIPLPFASSSMSGSSSDNKSGKRAATSQSGKEKKKAKKSSSTSGEGRDVFVFGSGENPTQRSRQMEPSSNSDEQHMIESRPFQSSSGELFRLMGSLFKSQIPKDLVEEAEKRSDGTISSFLASLEILMQEFTKVGSSKKASPATVDPSPVEVSNSFDALNVDAQPAGSSVSTRKKKVSLYVLIVFEIIFVSYTYVVTKRYLSLYILPSYHYRISRKLRLLLKLLCKRQWRRQWKRNPSLSGSVDYLPRNGRGCERLRRRRCKRSRRRRHVRKRRWRIVLLRRVQRTILLMIMGKIWKPMKQSKPQPMSIRPRFHPSHQT